MSFFQYVEAKVGAKWLRSRAFSSAAHVFSTEPKFTLLGDREPSDLESSEDQTKPVTNLSLPKFKTVMWVTINVLSTVLIVSSSICYSRTMLTASKN